MELPKVRSADTADNYAAAVNGMLEALHDPITHAVLTTLKAVGDRANGTTFTQRSRFYHGLPPSQGPSRLYYSGLLVRPGTGDIETAAVPLGANLTAYVRLSENVQENSPDVSPQQTDRLYTTDVYPSVEYRILAAYKVWGAIHYFFAYKDLLDDDWDKTFADYLPKFIAAQNAREYHLIVAEMISFLSDSHATVQSSELTQYFGEASVGLRLRLLEKKPVITEVLDEEARKAGVKAGDIVLKVDGEPIGERIKREANYISASTAQHLGYAVMQQVLNGSESSTAALTIAGTDNRFKEVKLVRSNRYTSALRRQRTGEIVRILKGNVGYVDLDRLQSADVDAMFDKLRDTQAIIFDMRGEAHGTAGAIASRLAEKSSVQAAIITGPLVLEPDLPKAGTDTQSASYFETQTIPSSDNWKYKKKTLALIDERTLGEAEHVGLFLEVANRTEFVGTPSAGADSDISSLAIPGGLTVTFSGHDIRHVNAGPLQRLGLQPTVTITPTIKGIQNGRDEVLEGALQYLLR